MWFLQADGQLQCAQPNSPHSTTLKRTPGGGGGGGDKKANKRNKRGETPLHTAAIRGDAKQARILIMAGVDVDIKDYAGLYLSSFLVRKPG